MSFTVLGYTYSIYGLLTVIALFIILILLSISDIRTHRISLFYVLFVLLLGVVAIWTLPGLKLYERFIGLTCVSVPLLLINIIIGSGKAKHADIIDNLSDKNTAVFGGGDVKLLAAAGFLLGWKGVLVAFMMGVFTGGLYAIYLYFIKKKKKTDVFALGPFLSLGIAVSIIGNTGTRFVDWIIMMVKTIAYASSL